MTTPNSNLDAATLDDRLAHWWETTTWDEVLDGWTLAGRDNCGCDFYTRPHEPGETPAARSFTAHDGMCRYAGDPRHPNGHVWDDHADDDLLDMVTRHGRHLSAFRVYVALHHAGDYEAALDAVGIPIDYVGEVSGLGTDFYEVPLIVAEGEA